MEDRGEQLEHRVETGCRTGNRFVQLPGGGRCVRVANILGFFVEGMGDGGDVTGHLVSYPGEFVTGAPSVGGGAAFLMNIQLVR